MAKATHNRIGPFFFDVPDFDDCGGQTTRRIEVPKSVVKSILEAAYQSDLDEIQRNLIEFRERRKPKGTNDAK